MGKGATKVSIEQVADVKRKTIESERAAAETLRNCVPAVAPRVFSLSLKGSFALDGTVGRAAAALAAPAATVGLPVGGRAWVPAAEGGRGNELFASV